jgi:hypothetical protein
MSTDFILMEGIRMVDEWPIIEKKIPNFDIVFRPVVDPALIEVGAAGSPDGSGSDRRTPASSTGRIRLSPEEERVFRKVDGTRTVQGIIDATGAAEFEICRTLFDFLNRNLIAPAGVGESRAREAERTEAIPSSAPGYVAAVLVAVLAVAGVLVQRRTPFAVTGVPPMLTRSYGLLEDGVMRDRLSRLEHAIDAWRASHGTNPATLGDLAKVGLVDRSYLLDPWRRPFHYEPGPRGYLLSAVDEGGRSRPDATLERRDGR